MIEADHMYSAMTFSVISEMLRLRRSVSRDIFFEWSQNQQRKESERSSRLMGLISYCEYGVYIIYIYLKNVRRVQTAEVRYETRD